MSEFLAIMLIWLASGDIYHCVDDQGVVQFSDQPCDQKGESVLRSSPDDSVADETRLRRWLDELRSEAPARARPSGNYRSARDARPAARTIPATVDLIDRPSGERLLAACSAEFLSCANGDDDGTDRCVRQIEVCSSSRRVGCCHAAYVQRYQTLRAAGATRRTAVRVALLGWPGE